jgi:hypothetical protein
VRRCGPDCSEFEVLRCTGQLGPMTARDQTRSFGNIGSMSGLPKSGHGAAIYEYNVVSSGVRWRRRADASPSEGAMLPLAPPAFRERRHRRLARRLSRMRLDVAVVATRPHPGRASSPGSRGCGVESGDGTERRKD